MAILNYTTSIDYFKTISEITKNLVHHGAEKIVIDYNTSLPVALTFCLKWKGEIFGFSLPANWGGVLKAMKQDLRVSRRLITDEQALKVSWRILKDWVAAQMAIVDAELAEITEVFFPYAITNNGNTIYKEVTENNLKILQQSNN